MTFQITTLVGSLPDMSAGLLLPGLLEWPAPLFDFQIEGVMALVSNDALLLADDMGLGKTVQAIAALRLLILQQQAEAALIVVPAGLIAQWRRALHLWAPELRVSTVHGPVADRAWQWAAPAHVFLTGFETLRGDLTENPEAPPRRRWDVVILDEAQRIKNRRTETSQACKQLLRRRAWALTGTPLENEMDDLASIVEFVQPLAAGQRPARFFPSRELLARHRTVQLRRRKVDVLPQLPPKMVTHVRLGLVGAQRKSYVRAEQEGIFHLRALGVNVTIYHILELILRLKQICNFCPVTGQSSKLLDLRERMATLVSQGHRALVFSQFTDPVHGVQAITSHLAEYEPLEYTGALSFHQREEVIREFKNRPERKLLALSLRAGGQGLNLQDASYVFHFDRWWNPAVEHQAEDRSHRLGQTFPVHIYTYTCVDTIEERIDAILRGKQILFDEVVDDVSIDLRSALTREELFGLFRLKPPDRTPLLPAGRPLDPGDAGDAV